METNHKKPDPDALVSALRRREPSLKDPEGLTEEIMNAIREQAGLKSKPAPKVDPNRWIVAMTRMLAAASVCLFLVFCYEQYVVVDKISRLEKQNAGISRDSRYKSAGKAAEIIALLKSDPEFLKRFNKPGTYNSKTFNLIRTALILDFSIASGNDSIYQNFLK